MQNIRPDLKAARKRLGLSQEQMAFRVGLKSKGRYCGIERGETPSVRVALAIERELGGEITADSLNPDVALVRSTPPAAEAA
jgi:transcriptional regulator with XRE-family HTH domain